MKNSFKKLILIIAILNLIACENVPVWKYSMFKAPQNNQVGAYNPLYIKGWQDGCQSGAESAANFFYRANYKFTQDWRLLDNTFYINGWEDAYNHCRKYITYHNSAQL